MKFRLVLACLVLVGILSVPLGAEISAASRITEVTIHPGLALVTREATVRLAAGAGRIVVTGLPTSLDASAMTVSGEGAFTIIGFEAKRRPTVESADERVREIEARIEAVENEVALIDGEIRTLEISGAFLEKLGELNRAAMNENLVRAALKPAELAALIEGYAAQNREIAKNLLEARQEKRGVTRRLDALRRELRQLQGQVRREEVTVVVEVSADRAGEGVIRLRYPVRGATWAPVYDGRALIAEGSTKITYSALIRQSTGEDWNDVKVTLSTAQPSIGAAAPELSPWELRPIEAARMRYDAMPVSSPASVAFRTQSASMAEEDMPVPEPMAPAPAVVARAEVVAGVNATFTLPGRTSVTADNQPRKVLILEESFPSRFHYRAIPELAERVYLVAKFTNTTNAILLPGEVSVYQGNDYIGKARLAQAATGDTVEVPLGVDPSLRLTRKILTDVFDPTLGSFNRNRSRLTRRFRITIENLRAVPVLVNVHERLPVARHDDIAVVRDRGNVEPLEAREDGTLRWEVSIEPGKSNFIEYGWRIEYPSGMNLGRL